MGRINAIKMEKKQFPFPSPGFSLLWSMRVGKRVFFYVTPICPQQPLVSICQDDRPLGHSGCNHLRAPRESSGRILDITPRERTTELGKGMYRSGTMTQESFGWECSLGVSEESGERIIASLLTPQCLSTVCN